MRQSATSIVSLPHTRTFISAGVPHPSRSHREVGRNPSVTLQPGAPYNAGCRVPHPSQSHREGWDVIPSMQPRAFAFALLNHTDAFHIPICFLAFAPWIKSPASAYTTASTQATT